jgi:hypothetical protein
VAEIVLHIDDDDAGSGDVDGDGFGFRFEVKPNFHTCKENNKLYQAYGCLNPF